MSSCRAILIFLLTFLMKVCIADNLSAVNPSTSVADIKSANLDLANELLYPTPASKSPQLPHLLESLAKQKHSPDTSDDIYAEYDYIVVGAGAAGSVVASRLSEVPCVRVLLLEAGPPPPRLTEIVTFSGSFLSTQLDWQHETVPQKNTGRGQINRVLKLPNARCLGGSTTHNAGLHVRGNKKDYDDWAMMGAEGWSYEDVLPYFKKLEDNKDFTDDNHGVGGPITVEKPKYTSEIKQPIFDAIKAMGYPIVDSNSRRQTGFWDFQSNLRNGQRCSTAKAYLVPADNRTNLDILPKAFVRKVVIENSRAVGVEFDYNGLPHKVNARREVILSAGAIKTPQILMLSGIGPEEHLKQFNIPVLANLPVGMNFQDHAEMTIQAQLKPHIQEFTDKLSDEAYIKEYISNRTGPLASVVGEAYIAFLLNNETNPAADYPNYQMYLGENSARAPIPYQNYRPEVFEKVFGPYQLDPIMYCGSQLLHPRSRGTIQLRSSIPYDQPVIDPNYLADEGDVDDIVAGLKNCKRILERQEMKQVIVEPFQTLYPGCEEYASDEDAYFRCVVRTVLFTSWHFCCSAKMGDIQDNTTVVDPQLRVKYIKGFRVVDASIMPKITHGNTAVPTIMIGEKAADMIKETIQCGYNNYHDQKNSAKSKSAAASKSSGGGGTFAKSKSFAESMSFAES